MDRDTEIDPILGKGIEVILVIVLKVATGIVLKVATVIVLAIVLAIDLRIAHAIVLVTVPGTGPEAEDDLRIDSVIEVVHTEVALTVEGDTVITVDLIPVVVS